MNCNKCQKLYILGLDEQLMPGQKQLLQDHLDHCPVCKKETHQIYGLNSELGKIKKISPSEELLERIRTRAGQRLLKTEKRTVLFISKPFIAIPRFSYAMGIIIAAFLLFSFFLPATGRFRIARLETKHPYNSTRDKGKDDFQKTEEYFNNIYIAKIKQQTQDIFSMLDKSVTLAKITPNEYTFSFSAPVKNIQGAIESLENSIRILERR